MNAEQLIQQATANGIVDFNGSKLYTQQQALAEQANYGACTAGNPHKECTCAKCCDFSDAPFWYFKDQVNAPYPIYDELDIEYHMRTAN